MITVTLTNVQVSPRLGRARKQHPSNLKSELSSLSPSSKSWWCLIKCVSGGCSPSITSNGHTADTAREKAECLNSVFVAKYCVQNPSLFVPTLPRYPHLFLNYVSLTSAKVESLLSNLDSDFANGPDGISPCVLKPALLLLLTLSLFYSPSHLLKVICHLLGNQQTLPLMIFKKVQKQIPATTDQSAFS